MSADAPTAVRPIVRRSVVAGVSVEVSWPAPLRPADDGQEPGRRPGEGEPPDLRLACAPEPPAPRAPARECWTSADLAVEVEPQRRVVGLAHGVPDTEVVLSGGRWTHRALESGAGVRAPLECDAFKTAFAWYLAGTGRTAFHGAAVAVPWWGEERAILITGASGAGKSTAAACLEAAGGRVLCDERTVLGPGPDGRPWVWGTPWHGTLPRTDPVPAPLGGLVVPAHGASGEAPRAEGLSAAEAAVETAAHAAAPVWDPPAAEAAVGRVLDAATCVPGVRWTWWREQDPADAVAPLRQALA